MSKIVKAYPYQDITTKLGEPIWYDEYKVPRYCEFSPQQIAEIYANEVALVLTQCDHCHKQFKIAYSSDLLESISAPFNYLKNHITKNDMQCGLPPNDTCFEIAFPNGLAMPIKVLEYWCKSPETKQWERDSTYEIPLQDPPPPPVDQHSCDHEKITIQDVWYILKCAKCNAEMWSKLKPTNNKDESYAL